MRHCRTLIICLMALVCTATQAQKKDVKVLVRSSILWRVPQGAKTNNTVAWYPIVEGELETRGRFWVKNTPIKEGLEKEFPALAQKSKTDMVPLCWQLAAETDQTVMHCYFMMPADTVLNLWLASEETAIIDFKTGIQYRAKGAAEGCWARNFDVQAPAGTILDFQIYFPPLPEGIGTVAIYGVPVWGMRGQYIGIENTEDEEQGVKEYDQTPVFRTPRLVNPAHNYDKDNWDTWAVYTDVHLIKPQPDDVMALWRTPEATYLAVAREQNWMREYYREEKGTVIIDEETGLQYKLRSVHGLPVGQIFWIDGYSGDFLAFLFEFEPLPLDAKTITYISPDGEPFNAWGASWKGTVYTHLNVESLRSNQPLFEYNERVIVK